MNTTEEKNRQIRKALPKIKVLENSKNFAYHGAGGVNGTNAMVGPENVHKSTFSVMCM